MLLAPGTVVDRFEVVRLLGEGGLARVYLVKHGRLGSQHALKVLHVASEKAARRFLQEGQVQARIRHPNLVPVTDVVEINGVVGLIMDFVDGPSLASVIGNGEPLSRQDIPGLFEGMCRGVIAAHAAGVLHRDLKPDNVLLDLGEPITARITDFGIAKVMSDFRAGNPSLTESGTLMGTLGYMAPEQLSDAKSVDPRCDVFSLGCILYEMLSGHAPYARSDRGATITATLNGDHRRLDAAVPGLPARLVEAVERAINPQVARRWDSVEHFRREVELCIPELLGQVAPSAPAPSAPAPTLAPAAPAVEAPKPSSALATFEVPKAAPPSAPTAVPEAGVNAPTAVEPWASRAHAAPTETPGGPAPRPTLAPRGWDDPERAAEPLERGRLLDPAVADRADRPRGPVSDRPLLDFGRNRTSAIGVIVLPMVLGLLLAGAGGGWLASERVGAIAAAEETAARAAAAVDDPWGELRVVPAFAERATDRAAIEAAVAAFRAEAEPAARAEAGRALVRALRTEVGRQGGAGWASAKDLAAATAELDRTESAVDALESALARVSALRGGWEPSLASTLGWLLPPEKQVLPSLPPIAVLPPPAAPQ